MICSFSFVPVGKIKSEPGGIITMHVGDKMPYEYRRQDMGEHKLLVIFFHYINKMPDAKIDLRIY